MAQGNTGQNRNTAQGKALLWAVRWAPPAKRWAWHPRRGAEWVAWSTALYRSEGARQSGPDSATPRLLQAPTIRVRIFFSSFSFPVSGSVKASHTREVPVLLLSHEPLDFHFIYNQEPQETQMWEVPYPRPRWIGQTAAVLDGSGRSPSPLLVLRAAPAEDHDPEEARVGATALAAFPAL